jgi:hypothetical protein
MILTWTYLAIFVFNCIMYFVGASFEVTLLNIIGTGFFFTIHLLEKNYRRLK